MCVPLERCTSDSSARRSTYISAFDSLPLLAMRLINDIKANYLHRYLEPLYNDLRKLRVKSTSGWSMTHVDEFVEELITGTHSCDIALPRLPPRMHLEDQETLKPYRSLLEEAGVDDDEEEEEDVPDSDPEAELRERDPKGHDSSGRGGSEPETRASGNRRRSRSRSRSPLRRSRSRSRDRRPRSRSRDRRDNDRDYREREDRDRRPRGRGDRDGDYRPRDRRDRGRRDRSVSHSNERDRRRRSRSRSRSRDRRKTKSKRSKKEGKVAAESSKPAPKDSVEYWNQKRAELGIKPLREGKKR